MPADGTRSWSYTSAIVEVLRSVKTLELVQIATGQHSRKVVEMILSNVWNVIEVEINGSTEVTQSYWALCVLSFRVLSIWPATVGSAPIPVQMLSPSLWEFLWMRVKQGKVLERLEIPSATVDADTLASLRVMVREVVEVVAP